MRNWLSWLFGVGPQTVPEAAPAPVEPPKREPMRIDPLAGRVTPKRVLTAADFTAWQKRARPLPGVVGSTGGLAMDSACFPSFGQFSDAYGGYDPDLVFLGYPTLSAMAQRVEYRNLVTAYAREATRKWVELKGANDDDERITQILAAWEDMGIRAAITTLVEKEGYFGRAHLYLNVGNGADRALPLILSPKTVAKGSFRGVQVIEPLWTYPSVFNSTDPFAADFYQTREWFVMGDKVHCTRLLTLVTHPVPDMLKSMYSFGGVARTQLIKPYVDNWLRSRQSVSDTMHKFSKVALKTNLAGVLAGGGAEQMMLRAALFNEARDNGGSFLLDMDTEELVEVSTPLSSLDKLQSQSFEQIAAAGQIPLLIYCRVTPSGLNASSEGELQAWYDGINALQEDELRPILQTVLDLTQLSLFGAIDPDIKIHFVPLYQMNELEKATIRKTDADAAVALINAGVLDPADERDRMGKDEQSLYYGMALTEPEPIEPLDDGAEFDGAQDAFEESDHPRDESGRFTAGGAGHMFLESRKGEQVSKSAVVKALAKQGIEIKSNDPALAAALEAHNSAVPAPEAPKTPERREKTPEQLERQRVQVAEYMAKVQQEKARKEQATLSVNSRVDTSPMSEHLTDEQKAAIKDRAADDPAYANEIATGYALTAITEEAVSQGWTLRHTSVDHGRETSRYLVSPEGQEVRLSDHYVPQTEKRESQQAEGFGAKWAGEVVLRRADWSRNTPAGFVDEMREALKRDDD